MPSHPRLEALSAALDKSPKAAEVRLLTIIDLITGPLDDLIDQMGVDNAIVAVNALYDKYVAPIDVPWVPDVLEPTLIDGPAKMILAAIIRRAHDKIHKD